jgi:primosomal protein N' (replication factor Y)
MWLYQVMTQNLNIPVLGPEEPAINKLGTNTSEQ